MSEAVDTRIVEAKFDSAQFEKGVDRTVKKLDELKKSLTFEQTGKSVADLASKAQDATQKVSSSLEKLENRITSFTGMLKQKLLSGIADEIIGVFFKIENSIKSLISSLTSGQMNNGMQRYSDLLTSVRVLTMSGVDESNAYKTMERLTDYADQTSYSLDEMVSTMSKFKTAGADLGTAERMIIGLSNAAASMGVNAQQAQRAYLNMQQAYSKGYMQQNDWISFESLPMVGEKFNQAILDAAVKMKTLKKDANGTYRTIKETDKQVQTSGAASKGITAENLGQKLSSKWFNKAVMEEVFGSTYYFSLAEDTQINELKDLEKKLKTQVKEGLITEEQMDEQFQARLDEIAKERLEAKEEEIKEKREALDKKFADGKIKLEQYNKEIENLEKNLEEFNKSNHFTKFGWDAFRAGQEARSFADVMNMLKDVISRGWATSFELIFGKLEDASKFFTELADNAIIRAIRAIIDFRNAVLETWADDGGREELMTALRTINDLLGDIFGKFLIFGDDEDAIEKKAQRMGEALYFSTMNFRKSVENIRAWLNDEDKNGVTRIDRIAKVFQSFGMIINGVVKVASIALNFIGKVITALSPVFDKFGSIIERITNNFSEILNPVKDTTGAFKSLENGFDKVAKVIEDLTPIFEAITGVLGDVLEGFLNLFAGVALSDISFFSNLIDLIGKLLGADNVDKDGKNGIDRIAASITSFGETCKSAFSSVNNFLSALIADISTLLGMGEEVEGGENGGVFSNLKKYFETDEFIADIRDWFVQLPDKILGTLQSIGNFGKKIWNAIDEFIFGKKVQKIKSVSKNGTITWYEARVKTGFSKWLDDLFKNIKSFFTDPKKIQKIWNTIDEFLFGKKVVTDKKDEKGNPITERVKEGFSAWLDNIITEVSKWIESVPGKISNLWNIIIDFIFGRKAEPGEIDPETGKEYPPNARVREGLLNWISNLASSIWIWLKDNVGPFVKSIWKTVFNFIFSHKAEKGEINPETGKEYPPNTVVTSGFVSWLKNISPNIASWFEQSWLVNVIKDIWTSIYNLIFGEDIEPGEVTTQTNGENYAPTLSVKDKIVNWITELSQNAGKWFNGLKGRIKLLWTKVLGFIFGKPEYDEQLYKDFVAYDMKSGIIPDENPAQSLAKEYERWITEGLEEGTDNADASSAIEQTTDGFLQTIGHKIGSLFVNLPTYIAEGINFAAGLIIDLGEAIKKAFEGKNADEITNAPAEGLAESINKDENKEVSPLLTALISIGQKIVKLVTDTIPGILGSAWNSISNESGNLFTAIESIFNDSGFSWDNVKTSAEEIGTKVAGFITSIPDAIRGAISGIKKIFDPYTSVEKRITDYYKRLGGGKILDFQRAEYERTLAYAKQQIENNPTESGLWSTIKEIGKSIGKAFVDLGPDILNGVNSLITWVSDGFTKFTSWLSGYNKEKEVNKDLTLSDYVTKQIEGSDSADKEKYSALWESAKQLGETIKNVITEVIPSFIEEAFKTVSSKIPEILGNLFNGGASGESMLDSITRAMMGDSGQGVEDAKDAVEGAVQSYSDNLEEIHKLASENGYFGTTFVFGKEGGIWVEQTEKDNEEADKIERWIYNRENLIKQLEDELRELNSTSDITTLKNLGYDLTTKEGQAAIAEKKKELNNALEELYALDASINQVEKDIEGHYKIPMPFNEGERIIRRREDLIKELTDKSTAVSVPGVPFLYNPTLPSDEDATMLQTLMSMESEYVEIADDGTITESKLEKSTKLYKKGSEGIIDIMESFGGIVSSIGNSDTIKVVAISLAIMVALTKLRDILSFADEIEAPGYTAKWMAIEIAVIGIFGIIGYILALAHDISDEGVARLNQTERTFDKIGDFIVKLAELIKWISIFSAIKTGFSMLETIKDSNGLGLLGTLFTDVLGFGLKGTMLVGGSEFIGSAIENLFDSVSSVISDLGSAVDSFMEGLGPAIEKLSEVNVSLPYAIDAVEDIGTLLQKFYDVFQIHLVTTIDDGSYLITNELSDLKTTPGIKDLKKDDIFEGIIDRLSIFLELSTVMSSLADSLKTFETIDDPAAAMKKIADVTEQFASDSSEDSDFVRLIDNLFEAVWEIVLRFSTAGQLESNINRIDISVVAAAFSILGDVMGVFVSAVKDLSTDNIKAFQDSLDAIFRLVNAFDGTEWYKSAMEKMLKGDATLSKLGREIKNFSLSAKGFFHNITTFEGFEDEAAVTRTERIMNNVIHVAHEFADVTTELNRVTNLNDKIKDFSQLTEMGSHLPMLGNNIATFVSNINTGLGDSFDVDRLKTIAETTGSVGILMKGLADLVESYENSTFDGGFDTWFGNFPHMFLTNVSELLVGNDDALYLSGVSVGMSFLDGFRKGVLDALKESRSESELRGLNDIMYGEFNFLMDLLTTGEYKPTITPVLNIDQSFIDNANQMREMLGFNPMEQMENGEWNTSLNLADAIKIPEQHDYSDDLRTIILDMGTMNRNIEQFNYNMSQMRLNIDGKDLGMTMFPFIEDAAGFYGVTFHREGVGE